MYGGKDNVVNAIITTTQEARKNPLHEPVPFDMSVLSSTKPNVLVTINDILSHCSGDCSYQT